MKAGTAVSLVLGLVLVLMPGGRVSAQTPPAPQTPSRKPAAAAATTKKKAPAPATSPAKAAEFKKLSTDADTARQAGHLDEAVTLYRQALAIKPAWPEGLWGLGTSLYEL